MIRFIMPGASQNPEEQIRNLKRQFDDFLHSDALGSILSLLGCSSDSLGSLFNARSTADGKVIEEQDMESRSDLESLRYELYPLFRELGALDINEPVSYDYNRIIILGGSLNVCNVRARNTCGLVNENTLSVDSIACYRPINPVERYSSKFSSACETEFGVMAEALAGAFGLDARKYSDEFEGDRNLNSVSCVRVFSDVPGDRMYRVFAAPSTEPNLRRADTFDSLEFYLKKQHLSASDKLLFVTSNRYCNRQFIQLASKMLSSGCRAGFDIVGCLKGPDIPSASQYDPTLYVNDLIGTIDWIKRFSSVTVSSC